MKIRVDRLSLTAGALVYAGLFNAVYILWLYPHYGYIGFQFQSPPLAAWVLGVVLAVAPATFMPIELSRPSYLLYWTLYLVVIVPSMFVPLFLQLVPLRDIIALMVCLLIGFTFLGASYLIPTIKVPLSSASRKTFWSGFAIIATILLVSVFTSFQGNLSVVSIRDVYIEKRVAGGEILGTGLVGYAVPWLGNVIFPVVMSVGLVSRRYLLVLTALAGQMFLYATAGQKSYLLANGIIVLYFIIIYMNRGGFGVRYLWSFSLLLLLLLGVAVAWSPAPEGWVFLVLATVLMRILGIPGLLSGIYQAFFCDNAHTYFSQVNLVGSFVHYPYQHALGFEVGYYFAGKYELDANAHFWVMDGLASLGLIGILVISLVGALVFWFLDSAWERHDPRFASLALCIVALGLCNGSLFTTVLTGGLGLFILLGWLMPSTKSIPGCRTSSGS